ncbi:MAG: hypothetical protein JHC57_06820 [Sphingopyxis sp.]|nr:hypothetical protein [Sphingopyxis sp.]
MKLPCTCRRCLTISGEAEREICPVCFREDDGRNESDADEARCGPNHGIGLAQARRNL